MLRLQDRYSRSSVIHGVGLGLLLLLAAAGGCAPRSSCPSLHIPQQGAYTHMDMWANDLGSGVFYFNPPDARIAIDPACSTACIEQNGDVAETLISGTIDVTIEPNCVGAACKLVLTNLSLNADDFNIDKQWVSQISARQSGNTGAGRWQSDNTFMVPKWSYFIWGQFNLDDRQGLGLGMSNESALWGTLDRDYNNFSLTGYLAHGVQFGLCGHPAARPPMAKLTPAGPFKTDAPGVAHVTFSSADSFDPDNDIEHTEWWLDNLTVAVDVDELPTVLSIGEHTVSVRVIDSRGVYRIASETVTISQ